MNLPVGQVKVLVSFSHTTAAVCEKSVNKMIYISFKPAVVALAFVIYEQNVEKKLFSKFAWKQNAILTQSAIPTQMQNINESKIKFKKFAQTHISEVYCDLVSFSEILKFLDIFFKVSRTLSAVLTIVKYHDPADFRLDEIMIIKLSCLRLGYMLSFLYTRYNHRIYAKLQIQLHTFVIFGYISKWVALLWSTIVSSFETLFIDSYLAKMRNWWHHKYSRCDNLCCQFVRTTNVFADSSRSQTIMSSNYNVTVPSPGWAVTATCWNQGWAHYDWRIAFYTTFKSHRS